MQNKGRENEQSKRKIINEQNEKRIIIEDSQAVADAFGSEDRNLKLIKEAFGSDVIQRGDELIVRGGDVTKSWNAMLDFIWLSSKGRQIDDQKREYVIALNADSQTYRENRLDSDIICFTHRGKPVRAKTAGQSRYVKMIRENDIVFGIGPAGTGKTYIAVAMAVNAYKNKEIEKILLARPAVEAGESLGFLPGDLQEKVDPYLRPLYDALFDIMGRDAALRLKEREVIEVVPLAYMRGRTLDNSFIILDEAQNTTKEQMKMFLTRLGFGSKAVVTGDVTQIDLPKKKASGLMDAQRVLKNIKGIEFAILKQNDVVRHPLVKRIIEAYERDAQDE